MWSFSCTPCIKCLKTLRHAGLLRLSRNLSLSTVHYAREANHYELLGVKQNASAAEVKAAFVELCKQIHPDRNPNDPLNHIKFVKLNEAYTVLSKPLTRREYDMTLAHYLYIQQNRVRGAGSHHSGSHPGPGSSGHEGQYSGSDEERVFWDETIWYMRDKSKDSFAADDEFYGVKGVKKFPNSYIVAACFAVMGLGFIYFFLGMKWSEKRRDEMLKRERKNLQHLQEARARAKKYGTKEAQIKKLKERLASNELALNGDIKEKLTEDSQEGKNSKKST